ncbi:general stress protein [Saccharibacillus sp. O23]|uniref:NAD(P)H-dependent oxidoreductase n=1 Tax=Saccharibacillus sp. O23 TaxID=2009338 RepID=UPI000B4E5755|nr:NAD(P)H-dependent oxidoreductase [Saccharibacillus sp. O23]OWR32703.1 general stress protein [Saccharibacillus sp. O23]
MKTLVIVAHPDLNASRINRAWIEALRDRPDTDVHSIYDAYPDWKIDVRREQRLLERYDRIIFQYPLYWYSTPPLLKKWFDEVLERGWAFGPGGDKLTGKQIGISFSTVGTADTYLRGGKNLFTIREVAAPMEALARYVHADYLPPFAVHDAMHMTDERLEESKAAYLEHLARAMPSEPAAAG